MALRAISNLKARVMMILAVPLFSSGLWAAEYFVGADGDDAAAGTSAATAWRSIARVNEVQLHPGDSVLFQAGKEFTGNLHLTAEDAGRSDAPVVIRSTEGGRATIVAGEGTGITVESAGNIRIENLEIKGAGLTNNFGHGILCDNLLTNDSPRLPNLSINRVDVSGFGIHGILITGARVGFEHVRVTGCSLHDNLRGGMEIAGRLPYDSPLYAHADVVVSDCLAFNNTGDPNFARNHSGSGIVLYQVDGGAIRGCTAWNNGALGDNRKGGGVGIWICAARRVVIEECESFANKTRGLDGGGFDIDGGCEECTLQYNYSHDNDGPGLMVYTYRWASYQDRGNVVRFNVSENDSRRSRNYAGLWVRADGRPMSDLEIYNNTVIIGNWSEQAAFFHGDGVEARVRNNIFVSRGQAVPLKVSEPRTSLRFEGNCYWRSGDPFSLRWGDVAFTSIGTWRAKTQQENSGGRPTGIFADPRLSTHADSVRPFTRVSLNNLGAFRPLPNSAARIEGLDLRAAYQIDLGNRDLLGKRLPSAAKFVGAILPDHP
jgi:hypothetical protein